MSFKSEPRDNSARDEPMPDEGQQPRQMQKANFDAPEFSKHEMQGGEKLIRLPELLRTIGVSRATAYRYMDTGKLPKPMKLSSRCVAWKASAINEWLAHLQAA